MTKKPVKKSKNKRTGRPKSTGAGTAIMVRMHTPMLKGLDGWIGANKLSRPEAVRQLVEWALSQARPTG